MAWGRQFFTSWLRKTFGKARRQAPPRATSQTRRWARPVLEQLETRLAPAAQLAITPISWNVIGLDSNNVNAGPNRFLVGARITNTGDAPATNVQAHYAWDDALHTSPYINLENPAATDQAVAALAPGASADFYYNTLVTRDPAAYNTARSYHIAASANGVSSVNTPIGRELYVEKLISQNRNSDLVITGPSSVQVGGTYTFHLTSATTPGGYDEVESFLTFSVSYRIVSVATTYTQPVGGTNDKIYADAGGWDNNPASSNYRTAVGPQNLLYPSGVGGIMNTDFTVTILSAGSVSVSGLILDHSGSSFHYDADTGSLFQNVTEVDNPPVANNDPAVTNENSAVPINVTTNDTDPNNNLAPTTVQVAAGPANGTAVVNPATGVVTYTPNLNFRGTDTFTYTVKDTAGNTSNPATVTVTVNPIDQPPVNTVPGAQTVAENIARVFSSGTGNLLAIADVDAGVNPVEVTLAVNNGTLTLNGTAGLTFIAGSGTNDPSVTFTGTLTAINAALNGLSYQPATNFNGTDTLTLTTNDLGNTGAGGPLSTTNTVTLNVTSANQPPVNTVPGTQSILAGQNLTFSSGTGNALSVFDVDAGSNPIVTTVSVPGGSGTLTLATTAGLTVTGNGTSSVQLTGPQANINTALNGLVYAPSAGASGTNVTLTVLTNDQGFSGTSGGPLTDTKTVTLRVAPINDTPVNTVPGAQTLNENVPGQPSSLIFSGAKQIAIADGDAGTTNVQVSLSVTKGTLFLSGTSGLTFISGGNGTSSMTVLGPTAAINNALNNLTYTPNANAFGADTLTLTTNDLGNTGSGGAKSATSTVPLTITQIDQAPVITVPTGPGYAQFTAFNASVVFSTANGNPISIADVDAGTGNLTVTLTITPPVATTKYALTLATTTGLTSFSGSGSAGAVVTMTGPLTAINAALNGLNFNPGNDKTGVFTLTINANDNGNTGSGGPLADTKALAIDAEKTVGGGAYNNQPPVNKINGVSISPTPPSFTTTVNTPLTFSSTTGRRLTSDDPDAGTATNYTVTLSVTNGTLAVPPLPPADVTTVITGNGTSTVTLTGIMFDVNNALNGLVFTPTAGSSSTAMVTITSNDQGNSGAGAVGTDTDSFNITVTGFAPPANTVPQAQTLSENTPFAPSSLTFSTGTNNAITVSDPEATATSDQVTLSVANGILTLGSTTGLTVTGNNTGTVTFSGSLTNINAALGGLKYTPTLHFNGSDTLTLTTTDTDGQNAANTVALTVTPVDDPPVNTVPGAQNVNENTSLVLTGGTALSTNDIDAGTGIMAVTLSVAHGTVAVGGNTSGLALLVGNGGATVNLTGTLTALNNALTTVTYTPTANYTSSDTLTVFTDDQGNTGAGGPKQATSTIAITVNPFNDVPVNTVPSAQTTHENTPLVPSSLTFSSGNRNQLAVADGDVGAGTIAVTLGALHGILNLGGNTSGLATLNGNGTATVSLTGTVTAINTAISSITYTPSLHYRGSDTLTLTTNDQQALSPANQMATSTVALTVIPVNESPVITAPGPRTANEDTPLTFTGPTLISVADIDANGGVEQVMLTAANGTLTLSGTTGLTFLTGTGTGDPTMTVRGTLANIDAALAGLIYTPTLNFNGDTTLTTVANDLGNTGLGGALAATTTINLHFNPVDDPPVNGVPGAQATPQGTPLFFNSTNGNLISISDVDAGSNPVQVTLTATNGTLTLSSLAFLTVTAGANGSSALTVTGTVSDLNTALAGLKFVPTTGYLGAASLTITTNDLGNTGSGGPLSASNTINITVTPVNDTPTLTLPGLQTFPEDNVHVFSTANGNALSIGDGDAGSSLVEVTLAAADGTLSLVSPTGLTIKRGTGTNDSTVAFDGTVSAINTALQQGFSLTPTLNFNGDSFIVVAVNDLGNTGPGGPKIAAGFVLLHLTEVNDPPVLTGGTLTDLTVAEDSGPTALGLGGVTFGIGGGADETTQTLTYKVTVVPPASLGSIVLADGTTVVTAGSTYTLAQIQGMQFTTVPDANTLSTGPVPFTFTVTDNGTTNGNPDPQTLTESLNISVTPVDDPPVNSVPVAQSTQVNTALVFSSANGNQLSTSDIDAGAGIMKVTLTVGHGTVTVGGDTSGLASRAGDTTGTVNLTGTLTALNNALSTLTYTPNPSYTGPDTLTLTTNDQGNTGAGGPLTATDSVPLSVSAIVVTPDSAAAQENTPATITTTTLLSNDNDPDGDTLTVTGVSAASTKGGTVSLSGGNISYNPPANYFGADTFTYTVSDGHGDTTTGVVTVLVNAPVTAVNDSYTVQENGGTTTLTVLSNDTNPDGDTLTITGVNTTGTTGTVVNIGPTVSYTPTGVFGTDTFTYTVDDGHGSSSTATVTVLVNAPVTAVDDNLTVQENSSNNTLTVLSNDTNPDGNILTITALNTTGTQGTVVNQGSNLSYTPPVGVFGIDTFTYTVDDGHGSSSTATVTVRINAPVTAVNDSYTVQENGGTTTLTVLSNDTNPDGDTLTITGVNTTGTTGAVVNNGTTVSYTPRPNSFGTDTFTYTVSDGHGSSSTATVTLLVNAPVTAVNDNYTVQENSGVTTLSVLSNDTNPDGDTLTITGVNTTGTTGTVVNNGTTVSYTPRSSSFGTDIFTYTVSDGHGSSSIATVTVLVNAPATAVNDNYTVQENSGATTLSVLSNDTNPDGDTLTITGVNTTGTTGTVVNNGSNVSYTPRSGFFGTDSFTYTVSDGHGSSSTATVTVRVDAPPSTNNKTVSMAQNTPYTFGSADFPFSDPDVGDSLQAVRIDSVPLPAQGTLTLNGIAVSVGQVILVGQLGNLKYTPPANQSGSPLAAFAFAVSDGISYSPSATMSLKVTAPPAPPTINPIGDVTLTSCASWLLSCSDSFSDPTVGPWVGTVNYGDGSGAQALTVNANKTFNLYHVYAQRGVYQVTVSITNSFNLTGTTSFLVGADFHGGLPQAYGQLVTVNDGSVQRSMVTSLTVTFTEHEVLDAGAITVTTAAGQAVGIRLITRDINGVTVVLIQFTDPSLIGGSLADGRYRIIINGSKIHNQQGVAYNGGNTVTNNFLRLFGDANGDGKVDATDLSAFQAAMRSMEGTAPYRWYFDYNQDCNVDAVDYSQFLARYGRSI